MNARYLVAPIIALALLASLPGCPDGDRSGAVQIPVFDAQPWPHKDLSGDTGGDTIGPWPCAEDADCPTGQVCDMERNICVDCVDDEDCPGNMICRENECVEVPICDEDKPCPEGWVCDLEAGICVECLTDEDCPEGLVCEDDVCKEPPPPCTLDGDCPPGLFCHPDFLFCVECLNDDHCDEVMWCDLGSFECEPDVCDPGAVACVGQGVVQCVENGSGWSDPMPCPAGTICEDGLCVEEGICTPGVTHCISDVAYQICADTGDEWLTLPCGADEFCFEDVAGQAYCDTEPCQPECQPIPGTCGPDLCGGMCDFCMDGTLCPDEAWTLPPGALMDCAPYCTCDDKECGSDGCGGWCGDCPLGTNCVQGQCLATGLSCSEAVECMLGCEMGANGDYWGCFDGCLSQASPESQQDLGMVFECMLMACGDMMSPDCLKEALYGICAPEWDQCQECQPSCFGKECGSDGCGGTCGTCPDNMDCVNGQCLGTVDCEGILECILNSQAPPEFAIEVCLMEAGPDAQAVFMDLYACVLMVCNEFHPFSFCYEVAVSTDCQEPFEACGDCTPSCFGKECGSDGCGGVCGICQDGWACSGGECLCQPSCLGKECGPDSCGGSCGYCPEPFVCTPYGKCFCQPDCVGLECGDDGCGGACGYCLPGEVCTDGGDCIPPSCEPGTLDCDGDHQIVCNEDGQGWLDLGPCPPGTNCQGGLCLPWICDPGETKCQGNAVLTCADSGMGWLAPNPCPPQTACQAGQCIPVTGCDGVPDVGCCDGDVLQFCVNGQIVAVDCGIIGCGWMGNSYECGGFGSDPTGQWPLACPGACEPDCAGKVCGGDGCGGSCGGCPAGTLCTDGLCEQVCVPQCWNQECGNDGCGGTCGLCSGDDACLDGQCSSPPSCVEIMDCASTCWFFLGYECLEVCAQGADPEQFEHAMMLFDCTFNACMGPGGQGDPACWEDAQKTQCYELLLMCQMCEPVCWGKECGPDGCSGSCGQCGAGQQCVDYKCEDVCIPQCFGVECGDNGCGGVCGVCKFGEECVDGICDSSCEPNCLGKECGNDGCGGSCGFCPEPLVCNNTGKCEFLVTCGDGYCDANAGEDCLSCSQDCGPCGTGCETTPWAGCGGCPCEECVCDQDPYCCEVQWDGICVSECEQCGGCGCTPACQGKECGPDGCGGSCGSCGPTAECQNGSCVPVCVPDCDGKVCGTNGCGGTCGVCPVSETCQNGICFKGLPCSDLIECALSCVSTMGVACLYDCLDEGTPEAQAEFFDVVQCVVGACGFNLNTTCMLGALEGACNAEYNECINCVPACGGKQCGPDGCSGICGVCPDTHYCDNYKCKPVCQPTCVGPDGVPKECGGDGCGGSCGSCPPNMQCDGGQCENVCIPSCGGKQCGSDGCGGVCGFCPDGFACTPSGSCESVGPVCGDGACDFWDGESCKTCPWDCGPCGDGCTVTQWPGCNGCACEECVCAQDPFCCNNSWDSLCVNECYDCGGCGCVPECQGKECGGDGCGGSCGGCPPNENCQNGVCVGGCQPDCLGKQCGSDGCGGSCGSCPQGFYCTSGGQCQPSCVPDCTDNECGPDGCNGLCGLCGPDEACVNGDCVVSWDCIQLLECLWDCPDTDEACHTACWEKASTDAKEQYIEIWDCITQVCGQDPPEDCPGNAIWYGDCHDEYMACIECTPACEGKQCGPDGCDGSCGTCPPGFECDPYGYCDCLPQCDGKECGSNGCGGSCGECAPGSLCNQYGDCVCMPQCIGKECGGDSCGGSCGQCPAGFNCSQGQCIEVCAPQCFTSNGQPKQCGPDGCGGVCGQCPGGWTCTFNGQCEPPGPQCGDGFCAFSPDPDGGESCLTCPEDCGKCEGDCCQMHEGPGCEDPEIAACVCQADPFCCMEFWHEGCAMMVEDMGCGECGPCEPSCAGKECGPDGCGGSCGGCPAGEQCSNGACTNPSSCADHCGGYAGACWCDSACFGAGDCCDDVCDECAASYPDQCDTCEPDCAGKECGPDGCGGTCGGCPVGAFCNDGGQCAPFCQAQCQGKECGPDGCGDVCGFCTGNDQCNAQGQCQCVPACAGKECGGDGCGGSCGTCGQWETCTASGNCAIVTPLCGDGNCMSFLQENCDSCPQDCGQCCGNGKCEAGYNESCNTCAEDCGTCCGNNFCEAQYSEDCDSCPGDCGPCVQFCGDGDCDSDEDCASCPLDCGPCGFCGDGECSDDESCDWCPGDCGPCPFDSCAGNCGGSAGGCFCDDACHDFGDCCDDVCDFCPDLEACSGCEPNCMTDFGFPKECGDDGCGGSCGECMDNEECSNQGLCEAVQQGMTCSEILQCANGCGGDWNCIMDCYGEGSTEGQQLYWALMQCGIDVCGLPPAMDCLQQAFVFNCSTEFFACLNN